MSDEKIHGLTMDTIYRAVGRIALENELRLMAVATVQKKMAETEARVLELTEQVERLRKEYAHRFVLETAEAPAPKEENADRG